MQEWRSENDTAMTFDEVSMERSKNFVKALQELKNLRPQLYSAAEYCEKSYLHNDQKQMVVDNLKDYAVRALVNAVDHLGTVAYKLTELFEQQTLDVSAVEVKVSCLNQQVLTCQTYADKEGLRQQQILAPTPKHHKHYILPNSVNQKMQINQLSNIQAKPQPHCPGMPASKTLSWHLASETNSGTNGSSNSTIATVDSKVSKITPDVFHLLDPEVAAPSLPLSIHLQKNSRTDPMEITKPLSAFRSFDNPSSRAIIRAPPRSKSMLSVFFAKTKASKPKKTYAH